MNNSTEKTDMQLPWENKEITKCVNIVIFISLMFKDFNMFKESYWP